MSGKPRRKDTPVLERNGQEKVGEKFNRMEIPEIIVESRDSDSDSGIKDVNGSNVSTPATSPLSGSNTSTPRFTVNPVSSRKNSEEQKFRFENNDTAISDLSAENNSNVVADKGENTDPNSTEQNRNETIVDRKLERIMNGGADEGTGGRKISEAPSSDSQPKSRKVSFMGEGQASGQPQFYLPEPGYLFVPSAAHGRKISSDSFYSQQTSRKSSLNAFYYPSPGHNIYGLPNHKISVFSMQSYDSDRTFRDTHEALPHEDHYKDIFNTFDLTRRPTLYELRQEEKVRTITCIRTHIKHI